MDYGLFGVRFLFLGIKREPLLHRWFLIYFATAPLFPLKRQKSGHRLLNNRWSLLRTPSIVSPILQNSLKHAKMPQCIHNGRFLFRRALRRFGIFLLRQMIVLASLQPALPLDLGDIQGRYLQASMLQYIRFDLVTRHRWLCSPPQSNPAHLNSTPPRYAT